MSEFLFSGEPLPLAPTIGGWADSAKGRANEIELENFHIKLLEYIRRLGAKLSSETFQPGGESTLAVFSAGVAADFSLSDSSFETIDWDVFFRKDTNTFGHDVDTNPDQITLLREGSYLFFVDVGSRENSADTGDYLLRLVETTLGIVDYSEANVDVVTIADAGMLHCTFQVLINAAAGSIFTVEGLRSGIYAFDTEHTRLTILFLPASSDTVYPVVVGCDGPFDCHYTLP